MKTINLILSGLLLVSLVACSGGGGNSSTQPVPPVVYATNLTYADPSGTASYRLIKNVSLSTTTRLVLDLYGPSGQAARGLSFFLSADTSRVDFVNPAGSGVSAISAGSVFNLGSEPKLLKDKLTQSNVNLEVGIYQKGGAAATFGSTPILSLALNLKGTAQKGVVALNALSGAQELKNDYTTSPVSITVGTVTAQ
jgi:hypothetical protein